LSIGLVNRVLESRAALADGVRAVAAAIAAKSPLAVRGIKEMLNYNRDHSVADGLDRVATWHAAMLMSEDVMAALDAARQRKAARFRD
jgi:enoyl-CoA hydratase/carnithine racemase